jgi:SAM-dependent methyltransferase
MYPEPRTSHNWLAMKIANGNIRARLPALSGLVLDLGCGVRPFEADILRHADQYVGLDWSKTLHGIRADVVSDLNLPLPFQSGSADHVVSFEVLEHLAEPRTMLAEAFRILRSGGQLTLSVPFQWWVHEAPWDYCRFTRHGLRYMLDATGFVDIAIKPTSGFWTMWFLKLNYQTARLLRGPSFVQALAKAVLVPLWWLDQHLAPALDRRWPEDRETIGYFVTAAKP